jgi:hypothetical protein
MVDLGRPEAATRSFILSPGDGSLLLGIFPGDLIKTILFPKKYTSRKGAKKDANIWKLKMNPCIKIGLKSEAGAFFHQLLSTR